MHQKINWRIAACFFLLIILSGCKIAGKVEIDGTGLEGVSVSLTGPGEDMETLTDENGSFAFYTVNAGNYEVAVEPAPCCARTLKKKVTKASFFSDITDVDFIAVSGSKRQTSSGPVIGFTEENGSYAWLGIPYAKPPVADLRWKSPIDADPWDGIYLALEKSDACPQIAGFLSESPITDFGNPIGSEDCLYMNIFSPALSPEVIEKGETKLPVMLWLHGGGNSIGEGGNYNGMELAQRHDLIVVTINYRLGPLGFFTHPALREGERTPEENSGNYTTLDILHALEWVQENIKHFGGDPDNVTVFGESAGAFNTLSLMLSKKAAGLFDRAIVQSATPKLNTLAEGENYSDDPSSPGHPFSSREIINQLLIADGLAPDREAAKAYQNTMSASDIREYLMKKDPETLLKIYTVHTQGMLSMPKAFADGTVLPTEDPLTLFRKGEFNKVPLMIGTNRDEMKLFMLLSPEYMDKIFGLPLVLKDKSYYEVAAEYKSNFMKARGVDAIASAMVDQNKEIYAYRFDWDEEPDIMGVELKYLLGAAHGLEIASVFGLPDMSVAPNMQSLLYTKENYPGRKTLSDTMSSYWAEFAHHGTPGTGHGNTEKVAWKPWTNTSGAEKLMIFDTPDDQGVFMSAYTITPDELISKLKGETRIAVDQKCRLYKEVIGEDAYYLEACK